MAVSGGGEEVLRFWLPAQITAAAAEQAYLASEPPIHTRAPPSQSRWSHRSSQSAGRARERRRSPLR